MDVLLEAFREEKNDLEVRNATYPGFFYAPKSLHNPKTVQELHRRVFPKIMSSVRPCTWYRLPTCLWAHIFTFISDHEPSASAIRLSCTAFRSIMQTPAPWTDEHCQVLFSIRDYQRVSKTKPWIKRIKYCNRTCEPFLTKVASLPQLTHLCINEGTYFTNKITTVKAEAPQLRSLTFANDFCGAHFEVTSLHMPSLEDVSMSHDLFRNYPVIAQHVCQYPLRTLRISGFYGSIISAGIYRSIPLTLRVLDIRCALEVADGMIRTIVQRCVNLEGLMLAGCRNLRALSALDLSEHKKLRQVCIFNDRMALNDPVFAIQQVRTLEWLELGVFEDMSPECLDFSKWPNLTYLSFRHCTGSLCEITPMLSVCGKLQTLKLDRCHVIRERPEVLIPLCKLQSLTELSIQKTFNPSRRLFEYITQIRTLRTLAFSPSEIDPDFSAWHVLCLHILRDSALTTIYISDWECLWILHLKELLRTRTLRDLYLDYTCIRHKDSLDSIQRLSDEYAHVSIHWKDFAYVDYSNARLGLSPAMQ